MKKDKMNYFLQTFYQKMRLFLPERREGYRKWHKDIADCDFAKLLQIEPEIQFSLKTQADQFLGETALLIITQTDC